jgi:hypothetical protein
MSNMKCPLVAIYFWLDSLFCVSVVGRTNIFREEAARGVGNASIEVNEEHCWVIKFILIKGLYNSLYSLFGGAFF